MVGMVPVGCGQCLCCRIHRRRLWTTRIILESYTHDQCCFVTLTYAEHSLPENGTVAPLDLQNFLKRLRRKLEPRKLRFFAVGEYGDETWRPHYHLALFGLSSLDRSAIEQSWSLKGVPIGFIQIGELNPDSAQYLAGYTVKKLTRPDDPIRPDPRFPGGRLKGRHPEFARMSNRPGIGAVAAVIISQKVLKLPSTDLIEYTDVPQSVRIKGKKQNIGRYLTSIVRKECLSDEQIENIKQKYMAEKSLEMSALLSEEIRAGSVGSPSAVAAQQQAGRAASVEARQKVLNSKRSI